MVAARVRQYRDERGWSAQRLGEEMKQYGVSWDRSIVANFEAGRRPYVTVEELLVLSRVFGVAAVDFVAPGDMDPGAPYQLTPAAVSTVRNARDWLTGAHLPPEVDTVPEMTEFVRHMPEGQQQALGREYFDRPQWAQIQKQMAEDRESDGER